MPNQPKIIVNPDGIGELHTAGLPEKLIDFPGLGPVFAKNPDYIGLSTHHYDNADGTASDDIAANVLYMAGKSAHPALPGMMFQQIMTEAACMQFAHQLLDCAAEMRAQAERDAPAMLDALRKKGGL